jgi:type II secretory pathway component PulK
VVIASIMILAVLVTDIALAARVRYLGSAHQRDEQKAYWLAASGVGMYRLLLVGNKQFNDSFCKSTTTASYIEQIVYGPCNDTLVRTIPILSTGLMRMLSVSDGVVDDDELAVFEKTGKVSDEVTEQSREDAAEDSRFGTTEFLDFEGDFSATVEGAECRVNVNDFSKMPSGTTLSQYALYKHLAALMDSQDDESFLRERNLTAYELIGNLVDWVDTDNTRASGQGGYEDALYSKLEPSYVSKNAKFDTPEEVRMVEGWQDDVYERWGKQLTIFGAGKVNISCADDELLKALISVYGNVTSEDQLDLVLEKLAVYKQTTVVSDADDFYNFLQSEGLTVSEELKKVTDTKNTVFTVTSAGTVGDATAVITQVVDMSKSTGTVLYYHVE